jgi:hypothetical protein
MIYRYMDGKVIGPRFWSWLAALVLGVLLGLWLAGDDRDPDAAAFVIRESRIQQGVK